jgi:DNA modification methylase
MKPYYEHAGIAIYHGDARAVLPLLPKKDLLLTDPPYGIGASRRAFGSGRIKAGGFLNARGASYPPKQFTDSDWDDKPVDKALLDLCRSRGVCQVIWGGNYKRLISLYREGRRLRKSSEP